MSVILLIIVFGVLNLSAGFYVAIRIGLGPPTVVDAIDALTVAWPQRGLAVEEEVQASLEELLDELVSVPIEDMLDDEEEEMEFEAIDEAYDDDVAQMTNSEDPEVWNLNDKYVETSILRLNIAMMKSGARATEIDTRLRGVRGNSDLQTIRQCVDQLREDCETYLAEQAKAAEQFSSRIGELGELGDLGNEIELLNMEQAAQIETTVSNLKTMDFESDLEAANSRLLEELCNLRMARHKLHDSQEVAFMKIARYESRIDTIEPSLYNDPLTRLYNRIGLECTLESWWGKGRHKSRQISAVLYDLDGIGAINEDHGSIAGDRILRHIGQMLNLAVGPQDLVGRYSGQRFLMTMVDAGPQAATKKAETFRQELERITFTYEGQRINVTACGGITEVVPEDTSDGFLQRLEDTLAAAKKDGHNRAFRFDPSKLDPEPELVESPNFGAKYAEVEL